ncbi:bacterio-opsin activator domain-containing protein [Natrarchaeobaculum sulfurireducens]|uniref:GGDEF domain protein n=1 Tax=Natrarchaeobaculum sulfurireducens TaxID=2044521 RepID=A0A346PTL2_9EURY|nr:bacterio-opsin activator domain-containing protein [Natrarchaeobaculum sulfurireducens]AXR82857.1 GGDEF domain protein [Natrarchaeobaculum sulfurireducens]
MGSRNDLAAATLETLPVTVAVIDDDGEILLTNRAWREFGSDEQSTDHVGVNYVATAVMFEDDDEYARQAVEGLESVLEGEQETFVMEYPCHTPTRRQWFMMRANRFTVDDDVRVSVVHLEITERKLAELAAEESAERMRDEHRALEHVLERIDGLVRDVTDAAVGAGTREEIERRVCSRLAATEPYVLAWVGRVDVTNQRVSPREWASTGDVPLEDGDLVLGTDETHPAVRALEAGEPYVVQDLSSFRDADNWWPVGAESDYQSVAALPLSYGDVTYGVLVLFAADADAFSDRELLVLESLAGTIATAMNAIESRRMLTTESVVELELAIEDSSLFVTALAEALEATVAYRGLAYDDGTPLAFFYVDRTGAVTEPAVELEGVADATTLVTYEDGTLLELELVDSIVTTLVEHGTVVRRFDVTDGIADLALDLANGQSARSVYDLLERHYDRVELISYHESEQPTRTPQDLVATLEQTLTDRQQMALQKAYVADYFEWPRNVSGEELAESMDISRSTFHQHLRTAQRKLLEELYEGDTAIGRHSE